MFSSEKAVIPKPVCSLESSDDLQNLLISVSVCPPRDYYFIGLRCGWALSSTYRYKGWFSVSQAS